MFLKQLCFEFFKQEEDSSRKMSSYERRRTRVYPTDISLFLDRFLPEYKEDILNGPSGASPFCLPRLEAVHDATPEKLIPFHAVMSLDMTEVSAFDFFHFFIHDYQFERMWKNPEKYLPFLLKIGQGIGPDFSMYLNMHPVEQMMNWARNTLLTFYLQKKGLTVIPNACFGSEKTLDWSFAPLPEHSILALSSQSCLRDNVAKRNLLNGIHELDRQKHPERLYVNGRFPEKWMDKFDVEIRVLPTFSSKWERMKSATTL